MANPKHLKILKQGVKAWNKWRIENPEILPDLFGAKLTRANLNEVDFSEAHLSGADLSFGDLSRANFNEAYLYRADLSEANLSEAHLSLADLKKANLRGANLRGASLRRTNFEKANLSDCKIYGISAWDVNLIDAIQRDLNISPPGDDKTAITVDNLEVAQFIYLLLNNEKIRNVIDTIGEKGVLILGRFTDERKVVLDAIREKLRGLGFVPMMFDFEKPTQRDFTETIKTLAGLSRFIIADITNPKSLQGRPLNYNLLFCHEKPGP